MPLRSVLVSVDFSEQSRQALRWAAALGARYQGRFVVLTVVDPLLAEAARAQFGQDLKVETEPALRDFVAAALPQAAARASLQVHVGDPSAVILDTAAAEGVQLIAIGTQGLGGVRKWLLGSTTERVLRRARVPVLAVPPVSKEPGVSRILAATDFSGSSAAAVRTAAQLASEFSAKLSLVHVIEPLVVPSEWRDLAERSDAARVADARERLQAMADELCGPGGCDTTISIGRAADLIGSVAEAGRADIVVMGVAGDQGTRAPRPGSIAYRVLCSAAVPVLVVPGA